MNNKTQNYYNAEPGTSVRTAIEKAIVLARATGKTTIVTLNDARFCVHPDTKLQHAIDVYLEVKNKMYETEKQLKQKAR